MSTIPVFTSVKELVKSDLVRSLKPGDPSIDVSVSVSEVDSVPDWAAIQYRLSLAQGGRWQVTDIVVAEEGYGFRITRINN